MGDPPPGPRFLASLGALSLVGLAKRVEEGLRKDPRLKTSHRVSWGILPQTPSRFARRAVIGWAC